MKKELAEKITSKSNRLEDFLREEKEREKKKKKEE